MCVLVFVSGAGAHDTSPFLLFLFFSFASSFSHCWAWDLFGVISGACFAFHGCLLVVFLHINEGRAFLGYMLRFVICLVDGFGEIKLLWSHSA
jgi:hypothetical protein